MNQKEQAAALGISVRTLQRWLKTGKIKAPEPIPGPAEPQEPAQGVRRTDSGPTIEELDGWTTEELQEGVRRWCKPDDPHGIPTSTPAVGSSTQPSPPNFGRFIRANAILEFRKYAGFTPAPVKSRPGQAFSVGILGPANSPYSYRPQTGYGLSDADLEAEKLTLLNHPQFGIKRFSR